MACTAIAMWPWPVTSTTGSSASIAADLGQPIGAAQAGQADVADDDRRHAEADLRPRPFGARETTRPETGQAKRLGACSPARRRRLRPATPESTALQLTVGISSCEVRDRQVDGEACAALRRGWRPRSVPPMARTSCAEITSPRPEPRAGRLAGDERLEQARQDVGADAGAGVGHAQDRRGRHAARASQAQHALRRRRASRRSRCASG